jgi:predicted ArsR family transcriptional regulator
MSNPIIATEEIRDALAPTETATIDDLAVDLAVSPSTIRRHLTLLIERGHVTTAQGHRGSHRATVYALTDTGRAAAAANEGF